MAALAITQLSGAPVVTVTPPDGTVLPFDATLTISVEAHTEGGAALTGDLLTQPANGNAITRWRMTEFPFSITFSNMPPGTHLYRVSVSEPEGVTDVPLRYEAGPIPAVPGGPFTLRELGADIYPAGINNRGQIAGYLLQEGKKRAFIYERGSLTELPSPAAGESAVLDINNMGVAAGWFTTESGRTNAVVWTNAQAELIPGLSEEDSLATGLNDLGHVIGVSGGQGFLWQEGVLRWFPMVPYAINNNGLVCGNGATFESWTHPGSPLETPITLVPIQGGIVRGTPYMTERVLYAANDSGLCAGWGYVRTGQEFGHTTLLYQTRSSFQASPDLPGDGFREALALNKWGQFVGFHQHAYYNYDPYRGPLGWNLNPPVATFNDGDLNTQLAETTDLLLRRATGINDLGQIIGLGERAGQINAFLLQPLLALSITATEQGAQIEISGSEHQEVQLEASPDFTHWSPLATGILTDAGMHHEHSPGMRQFYRARRTE